MEHQVPNSQSHSDLPMVVYLRGDEEFLEDFAVDAEKAMDYLGIKRSRLTQISGRELRVGRIRQDRYIRPIYRVKDLEDYKSWTRSTATSQSSSKVMEKAINSLSEQWNEFKLDSRHIFKDSFSLLKKDILSAMLQQKQHLSQNFSKQERQGAKLQDLTQQGFGFIKGALQDLKLGQGKGFEKAHHDLGFLKNISESLHLDIHKISQMAKGTEDRHRDSLDNISQQQKDLLSSISRLEEGMSHLSHELNQLKKQQEESIKASESIDVSGEDLKRPGARAYPQYGRPLRQIPSKKGVRLGSTSSEL